MALINKLTAIADAIREKTGDNEELSLDDMVTAIGGISGGGGGVEKKDIALNITGYESANYIKGLFAIPELADIVKTLTINLKYDNNNTFYLPTFYSCPKNITTIINKENNIRNLSIDGMFYNSNIDENFNITFNGNFTSSPADGVSSIKDTFYSCTKMKKLSNSLQNFIKINNKTKDNIVLPQSGAFARCYILDEQPNIFSDFLAEASRSDNRNFRFYVDCYNYTLLNTLKIPAMYHASYGLYQFGSGGGYGPTEMPALQHLYFTPFDYTNPNYKIQILYGSTAFKKIGWTNDSSMISYLREIYPDKEITDATSYNLLKNDPHAWTANKYYSRYNHDSAVETINSLPDLTLNHYTNTTGAQSAILSLTEQSQDVGKYTDGGAINTLTAAEIAVATEKGWTIGI